MRQMLRPLGKTKLRVSRLGLGLAALGRPGYINLGHASDLGRNYDVGAMAQHAHAVLEAAWQAGVRYFDAARSYGRAEEFLGTWLRSRHIAPADVAVGSKWGYRYTAGWQVQAAAHEIKEHSLAMLQLQLAESRASLGNYLQLYQIHSATNESGVLANQAVLAELAALKRAGMAIGLSLSGADQAATLDRALDISFDGVRLFDCVQATWNVLEPSAGPALERAHAMGLGIIVKEALANGRLTSRNTDPEFADQRALLELQAARLGVSVDGLALAAALAQPWAGVVLSGAVTAEQLESNVRATEVCLDAEAHGALAALAEPPQQYWETRKQLAWN